MKRKHWAITTVVVVVAFSAALLAHAHGGLGAWHHGPEGVIRHLTKVYGLSTQQQTEVRQMWESEKPVVMPLVQKLAATHKQMIAASANGNFDQAKVTALANEQGQTISQLVVEKEKMTAKFYTLLTPEQRTKFDRMRQRRMTHIDSLVQRLSGEQTSNQH